MSIVCRTIPSILHPHARVSSENSSAEKLSSAKSRNRSQQNSLGNLMAKLTANVLLSLNESSASNIPLMLEALLLFLKTTSSYCWTHIADPTAIFLRLKDIYLQELPSTKVGPNHRIESSQQSSSVLQYIVSFVGILPGQYISLVSEEADAPNTHYASAPQVTSAIIDLLQTIHTTSNCPDANIAVVET